MPEPASSFMVGNAPGGVNFAPPLLNFAPLANLPDAYFKGQANQRQLAMANAFPNGVPANPDGSIDINKVINTGAKLGGLNYVQGLIPYMMQAQMGQQAAAAIGGDSGTGQPANASSSVPNASGPANIRGGNAPQQQPQLSTVGADNNGSDTLRSVAVESFGGKDVTSLLPRFAQALGVDPDQPLSPQQVSQARTVMARTAQNLSGNTASDATGGGAPVSATGGASGSPAPAPSGNAPETAQPSAGIVPQVSPAASLVPQGVDPLGYANALNARAQALRTQAARYAAFPNGANQAKVLQEQAQVYDDKSKQIMEALRGAGQAQLEAGFQAQQPTPAMKDMRSGAAAYNATADANIKSAATKLAGVTGAANQYEGDLKPKLDIAQGILNDPRVWTGAGGQMSLDINKVKNLFGDGNAAVLQEMLQKVTASSILSQINGLKDMMMQAGGASSSAGRIFQQQVDLMNKASPQLETSGAGNRALVELERRAGEQSIAIRNLALQYLGPTDQNGVPTKHRILDAGFDKIASDYLKTHPLFTAQELSHPALLGSATVPPSIQTKADLGKWARDMQLQPGAAIRLLGGNYKAITTDLISGVQ